MSLDQVWSSPFGDQKQANNSKAPGQIPGEIAGPGYQFLNPGQPFAAPPQPFDAPAQPFAAPPQPYMQPTTPFEAPSVKPVQEDGGFFSRAKSPVDNIQGGADWWQNLGSTMHDEPDKPKKSKTPKPDREERPGKNRAGGHVAASPDDISEQEEPVEVPKFIAVDRKSVPIWTIMFILMMTAGTGGAIYLYGGFVAFSVNPMYGPDETSLISLGAKDASFILDGDWWRFGTSLAVHGGLIAYGIILIFMISYVEIERKNGFGHSCFLFLLAGVFGNILSCIFESEDITCGASGALFGWVGMKFTDLLISWKSTPKPGCQLFHDIVSILVLFVLGIVPYGDNFMNIGGFLVGILASLVMMPNADLSKCQRITRGILSFLAFPLLSTLVTLFLVLFYRRVDVESQWCTWCKYISCISINGWCK